MSDHSSTAVTVVATPLAVSGLWNVKQCAHYLGKSSRWLWSALVKRPDEAGSVPHVRIGSSPRFLPEDMVAWVRQGCPPAATFAEWHASEQKRKSRN